METIVKKYKNNLLFKKNTIINKPIKNPPIADFVTEKINPPKIIEKIVQFFKEIFLLFIFLQIGNDRKAPINIL